MALESACAEHPTRPAAAPEVQTQCTPATPPPPNATFHSDTQPVVEQIANGLVLRKTLDAYKTFGGYDVAYTGQTARWTFEVPAAKLRSATLVLSMIADDHATAIGDYRYTIWSGTCAHDTPAPLPHGSPAVSPFNNWIEVTVPVDVMPGQTLTVSLSNASTGGAGVLDWIAVRSIELRLEL